MEKNKSHELNQNTSRVQELPNNNHPPMLGELLVEQGKITTRDLAMVLSQQLGVPYINPDEIKLQPEVMKLIPKSVARDYNVLPVSITDSSLQVAMVNPNDVHVLELLSYHAKMRIIPMIATSEDIQEAINRSYKSYGEIEKQFKGNIEKVKKEEEKVAIVDHSIVNAPAVRALDLLIEEAIKNRASDIHIEPTEKNVRVRFRIDGVLHEVVSLPSSAHAPLLSRLKVLSNVDIGDHRPQDGQFSVKARGRDVDIRVATISTAYGEMGTLRILDKSFAIRKLSEIGFLPGSQKMYEEMIQSLFGMILISGPTGSGKTTTLYASINSLDRKERNIITIEDPIEYHLEGINQIQVNPRANLTFSSGLRPIMRHDPDVIVVGEMRDLDTISTAITAAETGHLVLGTLHTVNATQTIERIIDVFPANQQSQIRLQLSQVIEVILSQILIPKASGEGRIAAIEILVGTPAIRNLIRESRTHEISSVMEIGIKDRMQTMSNVLADLVRRNIITREAAMSSASNPEQLTKLLGRAEPAYRI